MHIPAIPRALSCPIFVILYISRFSFFHDLRKTSQSRMKVDSSTRIVDQMLIQRAMNFSVMALASSTRPNSSMSWTLPRIPDSKAEATIFLISTREYTTRKTVAYSKRAYSWICSAKQYRLRYHREGTHLVCSPINIIFLPHQHHPFERTGLTHIILRPEISRNIQFVHANLGRCPADALVWVKNPATSVIFTSILLPVEYLESAFLAPILNASKT